MMLWGSFNLHLSFLGEVDHTFSCLRTIFISDFCELSFMSFAHFLAGVWSFFPPLSFKELFIYDEYQLFICDVMLHVFSANIFHGFLTITCFDTFYVLDLQ